MTTPCSIMIRANVDTYVCIDVDKYKVQAISGLKRNRDGKIHCECGKFRFGSTCEHIKYADYSFIKEHESLVKFAVISSSILQEGRIAIFKGTDNFLLAKNFPDMSTYTLLSCMVDGISIPKTTRVGGINISKIFSECQKAFADGLTLLDKGVRSAGTSDEGRAFEAMDESFLPDDLFKSIGSEVVELKPEKDWKTIKRPNPKLFWVDRDIWETLVYCTLNGKNVLLTGPSGCGKSEVVEMVGKACELVCEKFNMGAMSEPRTSLIGATHASKDKGTWFNESRFVRAVKSNRGIILLDEISRCERGAFNILLPLMDRQGYLALDESEDAAVIHKGALKSFCATANLGMEYTGTEALDKALQDRFDAVVEMDFPDSANEFNVVKTRSGCPDDAVKRLIDVAVGQRSLYREGDFSTMISTRMLMAAAAFVSNGMDFLQASKFAILNQFSNEGDSASERAKLLQLIQKKG